MYNRLTKYLRQVLAADEKPSTPGDSRLVEYIKKISMFKNTPEPVLVKIANNTRVLELNKGDVLIRQGEASESLFIIRTGWLKIVAPGEGGKEVILNQCGPSQIIGEMSLLDQLPRSNTVIALSPATVLEVRYETVMEIFHEHSVFALSFLRALSDRLRFANTYIGEVIIWSQHIAAGNYDFVQNQVEKSQSTIVDVSLSDQARASAFLSAFFKMVKDIKTREENLKKQVHQLSIQIDEVKRQKAVEELTETEFFENLQATAKKLRQERQTRQAKALDTPPDSE